MAPSGAGLCWLEGKLCTHAGDSGMSCWGIGTEGEGTCAGLQRLLRFLWLTVLEKWKAPWSFCIQIFPWSPRCLSGWVCWDVGETAEELLQTSAVESHFFPSLLLSLFQIPTLHFLSFLQRQLPRSSLGFKVPKITKVKIN